MVDAATKMPLADVVVTATSPALQGEQIVVTDGNGLYRIPQLPPSVYSLRFEKESYQPFSRMGIDVPADRTLRLNVELLPETAGASAIVVMGAPAVDVGSSTTGASPDQEYLRNLAVSRPGGLSGAPRSFDSLANPAPSSGSLPPENRYVIEGQAPQRTIAELQLQGLRPPNGATYQDMFFQDYGVNPTVETSEENTSTFSVATDTAAYTLTRSYLERNLLPDPAAVRVEDFVNAFDYRYVSGDRDFAVALDAFPSPNRRGYHVLRVGVKARTLGEEGRKPAHVVVTIDVSGSMATESRLQLVKRALHGLVRELRADDLVTLVAYGDRARLVLPPTAASRATHILEAVDGLWPEGSTNAQAGLELAFQVATEHARPTMSTRVILCSDGVANNGVTSADGIYDRIRNWAAQGITLSTVGFGMGNYNDVLMERLAQVGHGQYAYVDRLEAAERFFVQNATGLLATVAEDVKVQVEFDRNSVQRYRLIGYEARRLEKADFENDRVDAGWVGAGHAVTALYEVKVRPHVDRLGTVKLRYKRPGATRSILVESTLSRGHLAPSMGNATGATQLAFVAAEFAEKLRGSYWVRTLDYEALLDHWERMPAEIRERPEVRELRALILRARSMDRRKDRYESTAPVAGMDFDRLPARGR